MVKAYEQRKYETEMRSLQENIDLYIQRHRDGKACGVLERVIAEQIARSRNSDIYEESDSCAGSRIQWM